MSVERDFYETHDCKKMQVFKDLESENARLREENERLRDGLALSEYGNDVAQIQRDNLQAEVERLREWANELTGLLRTAEAQRDTLLAALGNPEALAQRFHEAYEWLAPHYNYETRKESAVPWEDVPENNKALMTAVCEDVFRFAIAQVEEEEK